MQLKLEVFGAWWINGELWDSTSHGGFLKSMLFDAFKKMRWINGELWDAANHSGDVLLFDALKNEMN